jgi:hypothetical protein
LEENFGLEGRQGATRSRLHLNLTEWIAIAQRISTAVHDYLSRAEYQIFEGRENSDIFEQNKQFVHDRLGELAPEALDKFRVAVERLNAGGSEAGSQALTSCRRIFKALADKLYPAPVGPVACSDGKQRTLTDDKYVSRLLQFVHERVSGATSRKLLVSQLEEFIGRIERLYELASKGVYADVNSFEIQQCVLQTYLLIGDLLRLHEGTSGSDGALTFTIFLDLSIERQEAPLQRKCDVERTEATKSPPSFPPRSLRLLRLQPFA